MNENTTDVYLIKGSVEAYSHSEGNLNISLECVHRIILTANCELSSFMACLSTSFFFILFFIILVQYLRVVGTYYCKL